MSKLGILSVKQNTGENNTGSTGLTVTEEALVEIDVTTEGTTTVVGVTVDMKTVVAVKRYGRQSSSS